MREAPRIEPVPAGTERPLWSVMIPTFNNTRYLRQTLESVLAQDPGPDDMQIEVVDNCSTDHDIEEVVRGIAGRRVAVSRNGENLGAIGNFNRCIERSRGHLIHILHSDDFVSPNFYSELGRLASSHYDCAFYANRAFFVDEDGIIIGVSPRPTWMEEPTRDVKEMLRTQYFQCPGVVVRRAFYERFGGFAPELVYCADWEMWVRAVSFGMGVVHPQPLASYRTFAGNESARLARSGENVRDYFRLDKYFRQYEGYSAAALRALAASSSA